ncbi:amidohydrolase family protein [Kordiimonas sp. SCSIO 12610]|uniref:Xaa-Pro dipeptidase n=1 Tax=Kordiimonas sp. SCSIO 12610 TaxID=2829597 RepID=UPI0021086353|nr:amidohydrolase family protein [Kordiimonas sp. SCSIO 12610]UTW55250.1 amidohydrolase family protein [Kordiimonas sp. SCSIO 12610]
MRTTTIIGSIMALAVSAHIEATDQYLTADAMVDIKTGKIVSSPALIISNGKIVRIGTQKNLPKPQGMDEVDLTGHTIMPGLMDMHVHLTGDATTPFFVEMGYSLPRQTVVAVKNAKTTLMAGYTTVRNVGAPGYSVIGVRDGINDGDIVGPRIYAAGPSLGITGGHCDNNFLAPELKVKSEGVADGVAAVRAKVRENIKYGANAIKLCATGGVFSKGTKVGIQQYTVDEIKAAVDEAHRRGLTVAAHAHGTEGIKAAIIGGVDSVEHASFLDAEAIELAKEYGTYLSMDIYNTEYTLTFGEKNGVPEENLNKERQVSKRQRDSFSRAVKAGAKMVFGSDAAIYPHGDNAKQLSRMVRYGMTPLQALQAATINSATLLGREGDLGLLEEGYMADIIAVRGNPLDDVSILENVAFVMKEGETYKTPEQ